MSRSPTPSASAGPTVPSSSASSERKGAPTTRDLPAGLDLLALHAAQPERYPFLLESAAGAPDLARYDLLLAFPGRRVRADAASGPFVQRLDAAWQEESSDVPTTPGLPFAGGWFLYLGYELAGELEPRLALPPADDGLPAALAVRIPAAILRDRLDGRLRAIAEPGAEALLDVIAADARACPPLPEQTAAVAADAIVEADPAPYLEGIERIRRYIREGDVFQVNLARAWGARIEPGTRDATLYQGLRRANPAPFAALCALDGVSVISSSPERLVSVREGRISTRPIAGTRPRGALRPADLALSAELLAHPKERAEHVMLVDLERNDLGRVCRPGTVRVDEFMILESYAHVHHIVSNVCGRLRPEITPGAVIRALFPGGTITGCPKLRCMEIIAELEPGGRGAYTGAVGYLGHDGSLDLNILIRTLVRRGGELGWRTGAGIVADSDPAQELAETRHKAEGLLRALRA
jgi:anthranilate synthase component 1